MSESDARVARTRAAVLGTARDLLVEGGPAAVTVDAIVTRSGVAKSTIYRHWSSRDDLLADTVESAMPPVTVPDPALGFAAAMTELLDGFVDSFTDPEWSRMLPAILALKLHERDIAGLERRMHDAQLAVFTEVLTRGVRDGDVRDGWDPEQAAAHLIGPLFFTCLNDPTALDHALARRTVERFLDAEAAALARTDAHRTGRRRAGSSR